MEKINMENHAKDILFIVGPKCDVLSPPLSVPCLTAYLRKNGFDVEVYDLNLACYLNREEKYQEYWTVKFQEFWMRADSVESYFGDNAKLVIDLLCKISDEKPRAVGFTNWFTNFESNLYIAGRIKTIFPETKIIFGGPEIWMRLNSGRLKDEQHGFIDAFVVGEGEETLVELMALIKQGEDFSACPGIAYFHEKQIISVPGRRRIMDLTRLPAPDYTDFDLKSYVANGKIINAYFSRGCVNKCIYCDERTLWGVFRTKSGMQVFNEVKEMSVKYPQMIHIYFNDSLVNGSIRALKEFCHLMISSSLKIEWEVNAIIRKEMDAELLSLMHKAGCRRLIYGVESTSHMVLANVGKVFSRDADLDKIIRDTSNAGIEAFLNFMFGLPGETDADALENIDFVIRNKDYIHTVVPTFALCNLSPFSDAYLEPEKFGIKKKVDICYWESADGTNNFPVRLARFERFCRAVNTHKINTSYPHDELMDRDKKLGFYYCYIKEFEKAAEFLVRAVEKEPWDSAAANTLKACRQILANNLAHLVSTG
jgi:anaerobic magnesium-protoporphyrin IX monomethyl ester cyclase